MATFPSLSDNYSFATKNAHGTSDQNKPNGKKKKAGKKGTVNSPFPFPFSQLFTARRDDQDNRRYAQFKTRDDDDDDVDYDDHDDYDHYDDDHDDDHDDDNHDDDHDDDDHNNYDDDIG
ncbi:hypothetical protein SK128_011744 [Halocaridina rubra]|uniref:Uncharacterized protein n=1 Tax=Halocaridina rubra TaxID=373956 RepID=A0AAN8X0U1_HALRR